MPVREVVDAHHHLWDLTRNHYPWLTDKPNVGLDITPFARDYHVADYRRDAGDVTVKKSVHVQAGWDPSDPVGETIWLEEVAARHGIPHAIVAHADLAADDAPRILKAHAAHRRVRGVRMLLTWHPEARYRRAARPDILRDPAWRRGIGVLADLGLSFDMQIYPLQMADAARVAREFSGMRFIIDHMGLPIAADPAGLRDWETGLRRLSEAPNVAIKLSGFSHFLPHWSPDHARRYVDVALSAFGPDRCLFGSNFPVDRPFADFADLVDGLAAIVPPGVSDEVFVRNAIEWYRLDD